MNKPKLVTFTVMKNEGPFVLEWVAYQKVLGVDRVIVLTNDCDDGTDALLDRLEDLGLVRHLPNPCVLSAQFKQPHRTGIAYAKHLRDWRDADYIFLSDVDEFALVNVGDGSLKSLLEHTDYPDAISIHEMLFGTGGITSYEDTLVTESFTRQCPRWPDDAQISRRGFKSIHRNKPDMFRVRNHRPLVGQRRAGKVRWLDGSGNDFPIEMRHLHQKGGDCRGSTDLAVINHYTIRSLESFMVKMARGDAMVAGRIGKKYFRKRNMNQESNTDILRMMPRLHEELSALKRDPHLLDLHLQAVEHHKSKIKALLEIPEYDALLKELGQGQENLRKTAA